MTELPRHATVRMTFEPVRPIRQETTTAKQGPVGFRLCHELEGLLEGILADQKVVRPEVDRLVSWLATAEPFRHVKPFSEIVDRLEHGLRDGVLTTDECEDLLFVIQRYTTVNPHFDALRTGIQI